MSPHDKDGDWAEYRRLVLAELERLNLQIENLKLQIDSLNMTAAENKIKLGLIGVIAGSIPVIIGTALQYYFGR